MSQPPTHTAPAPAPTHLIETTDDRLLAVDERGPGDGPAVVFLHPAPGSRNFDPDPAATAAAGIRLVTVDRAGYGGSTPLPDAVVPSVAGHADDVATVLEALGLDDVRVVGWSAGGRVALALAARHPDVVLTVGVVGTPAPDDQVPWVPDQHRALATELRREPDLATATIAGIFSEGPPPADDALAMVSGGSSDEAVMADPARRAAVLAMLDEGFRPGAWGVAADIVADQVVPWGFDLAAIGAPVALFYGDDDQTVTPGHGRWYAERLADPTLTVVPAAGHLLVMTHWPKILDVLLRER